MKLSFVEYVSGLLDGGVQVTGDATADAHGMFTWHLASAEDFDGTSGTLRFAGTVRFSGHFGALDVSLADPIVVVADGRGVLHTSAGPDGPTPIVAFTLTEVPSAPTHRAWLGSEVALTPEGSVLFGSVYAPGDAFEPLIIALAR